jgi:hypothetical protein
LKNFRQEKRDMDEVPFWKPTDIKGHLRELRFCSELASRIFAPLPKKQILNSKKFQTMYIDAGIYLYLL